MELDQVIAQSKANIQRDAKGRRAGKSDKAANVYLQTPYKVSSYNATSEWKTKTQAIDDKLYRAENNLKIHTKLRNAYDISNKLETKTSQKKFNISPS